MNCKKVRQKLSAYIDNETNLELRESISKHLSECAGCKTELNILLNQNKYLMKLEPVKTTPDFRLKLYNKIVKEKQLRINPVIKIPILRWVPVPITIAVIIFIFFTFSIISPVLYSQDKEVSAEILLLLKNTFGNYTAKNMFAALNYLQFCNDYCRLLCHHCTKTDGHKCLCGGCCK